MWRCASCVFFLFFWKLFFILLIILIYCFFVVAPNGTRGYHVPWYGVTSIYTMVPWYARIERPTMVRKYRYDASNKHHYVVMVANVVFEISTRERPPNLLQINSIAELFVRIISRPVGMIMNCHVK